MPQLDKLLSAMLSNKADMLILKEDAPASLRIGEQSKSLTKGLTGAQVVALVREIAPADAHKQIDGKAPVTFQYDNADGVFLVKLMLQANKWHVSLTVDDKGDF